MGMLLPRPNSVLELPQGHALRRRLGIKMYNRSNLGTFYTRKMNLVRALGHNFGTFHARKL